MPLPIAAALSLQEEEVYRSRDWELTVVSVIPFATVVSEEVESRRVEYTEMETGYVMCSCSL